MSTISDEQKFQVNNMNTVTIKNGFWFFFEDNGLDITVNASVLTGKETVYINDNPVSEKRSLGVKSKHQFQYNGKQYQIQFDVLNILTHKVECTFSVNKKIQSTQTKAYFSGGLKSFLGVFAWCVGFGIAVGFITGFLFDSFGA